MTVLRRQEGEEWVPIAEIKDPTLNPPPLFFFWGQQTMSFLRYMTLRSACAVHRNVILILRETPQLPKGLTWKETQDFQGPAPRPDYMEEAKRLPLRVWSLEEAAPRIAALGYSDVHTSDLLAWWLLGSLGGTVADMDIVFTKPLPHIEHDVELVCFSGHPKPGYIPVTYLQGRPCESWVQSYLRACEMYRPNVYESCGTDCSPPAKDAFQLPEKIVFPWARLYKWSSWHPWLFGDGIYPEIPLETVGIHWYASRNQEWNRKINGPDALVDGAVSDAIRKVLG